MADHDCRQEDVIKILREQLANGKEDFRELRNDIKTLLQEVATLKEKARNWGAIFGAGAALGVNIIIAVVKAIGS